MTDINAIFVAFWLSFESNKLKSYTDGSVS